MRYYEVKYKETELIVKATKSAIEESHLHDGTFTKGRPNYSRK